MNEKISIENLFDNIIVKESWEEIITTIFEVNIQLNKPNMINDIALSLEYAFNINGMSIINLIVDEQINLNRIKLDEKFKNLKRLIELLKAKYKMILIFSIERAKNPFGLNGVGSNIGNRLSHSTINFLRNDGEVFEISCTLQEIINMNITFNKMISSILDIGAYTINDNSINELLATSNEIRTKIGYIKARNN